MTRTPRPLRPGDLVEGAAILEALAAEFRAEHAAHVQATIGAEIDAGYPATTSGAGGNSSSTSASSRPEALTIRPDRTATEAVAHAALQRKIIEGAATLLRGLRARDPRRKVRSCPRCNHVIPDGMSRCNRMIDGTRCGVCKEPDCPRDGEPLGPGEKMRNGRCDTCRQRVATAERTATQPRRTGAVASVANLVDGMADIEVAD